MSNNDDENIDGGINETLVYSAEVQRAIDEVCYFISCLIWLYKLLLCSTIDTAK